MMVTSYVSFWLSPPLYLLFLQRIFVVLAALTTRPFLPLQVLDHVVALTQDHGLGILMTGSAEELQRKSQDLKSKPTNGSDEENRPRKEDIVKDE
jgi:hypothetical protein